MRLPGILGRWRLPSRRIDIAACFDKNLFLPFVVFASALAAAMRPVDRPVTLYAFHLDPLTDEVKAMIERMRTRRFRIELRAVTRAGVAFPLKRKMSEAAFTRLRLCDLLPNLDKVLYLDVDTLVLRPIDGLYDTPLGDDLLAACRDYALSIYANQIGFKLAIETIVTKDEGQDVLPYLREVIGLPEGFERNYFNTGVMLLNLKEWRRARVGEEVAKWAIAHPESIFHDQDALNAIIKGRYRKLDHRWNSHATLCDLDYLREEGVGDLTIADDWAHDPWIVHYAGMFKPWSPTDYITRHEGLFWKFARRTPAFEKLSPSAHPEALEASLASA